MVTTITVPKPPKTFLEQLGLLKRRGLIVENDSLAIETLKDVNYYRLRGYYIHLYDHDAEMFKEGVSFNQIVNLHSLDAELQILLLSFLHEIEINLRTRVAYLLGHQYGPMGYTDLIKNRQMEKRNKLGICNPYQHSSLDQKWDLLKNIEADIARSKERYVKIHKEKYGGNFPIWVAVEMMAFGNLSKLFELLPNADMKKISEMYNFNIHYKLLKSRIHYAVVLRNLCSHNNRIYARYLPIPVSFSRKESDLLKKHYPTYHCNNQSLFSYLIVLREIVPAPHWNHFHSGLTVLFSKYKGKFEFMQYGFPWGWNEMLGNKL